MSEKFSFTPGNGIRVGKVEILEFTFDSGYPAVMNPPDVAYPEDPPELEIMKAIIEDDGEEHEATDMELEDLQEDEGFWEDAEMEIADYLCERNAALEEDWQEGKLEEAKSILDEE